MRKRIFTAVCFLSGLAICFYPFFSNLAERRFQREAVATYRRAVERREDPGETLRKAQEYNRLLSQTKGAAIGTLAEGALSEESYRKQLALSEDGIMGTVEIPRINVNLPVYHGTSDEVLAKGAGHLRDSSLPAGGENTRCVLTGHRGLPSSRLFTRLDELEEGDLFYLNVCGETLAYRVSEVEVIRPDEADRLQLVPGKDIVSLVTCTPYGINTHRLVVNGERISYREKEHDAIRGTAVSARELLFLLLPAGFLAGTAGIRLINRIRKSSRKRCNNVRI